MITQSNIKQWDKLESAATKARKDQDWVKLYEVAKELHNMNKVEIYFPGHWDYDMRRSWFNRSPFSYWLIYYEKSLAWFW